MDISPRHKRLRASVAALPIHDNDGVVNGTKPMLRTAENFSVPGLNVTDHFIAVPLTHGDSSCTETIEVHTYATIRRIKCLLDACRQL